MSLAIKRGKARGDPGLWSSIRDIGAGFLGGGVSGGVGAIGQQLGLGSLQRPAIAAPLGAQINLPFMGPPGAGMEIKGPLGFGFEFGVGELAEGARMLGPGAMNGKTPPGYHYNKTGYFVKGPPAQYIPAGTKLVRNRRRNPLNPRAFDRALGRVGSAKAFGEKLKRVTIRKKCACK